MGRKAGFCFVAFLTSCSFDPSQYMGSGSGGANGATSVAVGSGSTSGEQVSSSHASTAQATSVGTTTATASVGSTSSASTAASTSVASTSSASASSTSVASTSIASTSAASTSASSTTSATTSATSSSTSATTSATTAASTSTGGPVLLDFCDTGGQPVSDDFNSMTFQPFWTFQNATDNGMQAITTIKSNTSGWLFLDTATTIDAECALTVELVSANNGAQRFRLNMQAANMGGWERIKYASGSLNFHSNTYVPVALPVTLAFVSHNGVLYAGYKSNGVWTRLEGSASISQGQQVYVGMTEEDGSNNDSGKWDDFNITRLSLADLGL